MKNVTDVINNLTDDSTTFLWRLGTVRLNWKDYTDGTLSLFNLSEANNDTGYKILDEIDFSFYKEHGFQILEAKDASLLKDTSYFKFKREICDQSKETWCRRQILWMDSNRNYRLKLLRTRYFVNTQPVTLNQKMTQKIIGNLLVSLKEDLDILAKSSTDLIDTTTNDKVNTNLLSLYLSSSSTKIFNLKGEFISAAFREEYARRAKYVISLLSINGGPKYDPTLDEFTNNLKLYFPRNNVALNSAVIAFKFSGTLNNHMTSTDSIKTELSKVFKISGMQAASLAAKISFSYSRNVDQTFTNEFSKVWLIMFGTDGTLDKLHDNDTIIPTKHFENVKKAYEDVRL